MRRNTKIEPGKLPVSAVDHAVAIDIGTERVARLSLRAHREAIGSARDPGAHLVISVDIAREGDIDADRAHAALCLHATGA